VRARGRSSIVAFTPPSSPPPPPRSAPTHATTELNHHTAHRTPHTAHRVQVYFDGTVPTTSVVKKYTAYIQQQDCFFGGATVAETILFAAMSKLSGWGGSY
jgi:hypothetical protein